MAGEHEGAATAAQGGAAPQSAEEIAATLAKIDAFLDGAGLGENRGTGRMLLVAACITGPNEAALVELLGLDAAWVHERGERLRASEVWKDGQTHCQWFGSDEEGDEGGMAFLLDVMCAEGLVARAGVK